MSNELNNHHLMHLVDERATAVAQRDAADAKVKTANAELLATLEAHGLKRHQLPNGTILTIVQQKDRQTVVPELLLQQGVKPAIIQAATKPTPVAPFIRVDAPKAIGESPFAPAVDAAATTAPTTTLAPPVTDTTSQNEPPVAH